MVACSPRNFGNFVISVGNFGDSALNLAGKSGYALEIPWDRMGGIDESFVHRHGNASRVV
jgi:hypothetical protein